MNEKEFIELGAMVSPTEVKVFTDIIDIYVGMSITSDRWGNQKYLWEIVAQIDEEGAGDIILMETEYKEIAEMALPLIREKYKKYMAK